MYALPPTQKFIAPCEHRISPKPDAPTDGTDTGFHCKLVSDYIGHAVRVLPITCADCCLEGQINYAKIKAQQATGLWKMLNSAILGFYSEDDSITIVRKLWPLLEAHEDSKKRLAANVLELVRLNRVSLEKMSKVIEQEMPELDKYESA